MRPCSIWAPTPQLGARRVRLRASVKKLLLYVLPELVIPAAFGYCLWGIRYGDGWVSLAHAACLGVMVPVSAVVGVTFVGLALLQRQRGRLDWHWCLVSAAIAGGPAFWTLVRNLVV